MSEVNFILPLDLCRSNLKAIQQLLDEVCPQEAMKLMEHLNQLASMIGLSAQTQSSYRYHLEKQMNVNIPIAHKMKLPASLIKDYAHSCIPEIVSEYELAERLNRGITHKMDAIRSILSYTKMENFNSKFQTG